MQNFGADTRLKIKRNINLNLIGTSCSNVHWIELAHYTVQWQDFEFL
jgi:hypothetical protein